MGELKLVTVLIGQEEIEVLNDIKNRCYFGSLKEKQKFVKDISKSVGCETFAQITEDDFETAFNLAIHTLRTRGERILQGKKTVDAARGAFFQSFKK